MLTPPLICAPHVSYLVPCLSCGRAEICGLLSCCFDLHVWVHRATHEVDSCNVPCTEGCYTALPLDAVRLIIASTAHPSLQAVGSLQLEGRAAGAGLWPVGLLSTVPVGCVAQLHLLSNVLEAHMGGLPLLSNICMTLQRSRLQQLGIQANWQKPALATLYANI